MSERVNWQQETRKRTLNKVGELMQKAGGFSRILIEEAMPDFEKYISFELGCSIRQAKDYIETLRGAAIFQAKLRGTSNEV